MDLIGMLDPQLDYARDAVLVFLPGVGQISKLSEEFTTRYPNSVDSHTSFKEYIESTDDEKYYQIIQLHAKSEKDQEKIAMDAGEARKKRRMRIILATNIAETSLTIPGVSVVIDWCVRNTCKYDTDRRIECLQHVWCSKASAKQRMGRTGRTCEGTVYRLVPTVLRDALREFEEPAARERKLSQLILGAKILYPKDEPRTLYRKTACRC